MNAVPEPEKPCSEKTGITCPSIPVMPPETALRRAPSVRSRNRAKSRRLPKGGLPLRKSSVPDAAPARSAEQSELAKKQRKMYLPELPRRQNRRRSSGNAASPRSPGSIPPSRLHPKTRAEKRAASRRGSDTSGRFPRHIRRHGDIFLSSGRSHAVRDRYRPAARFALSQRGMAKCIIFFPHFINTCCE